MNNEVAANAKYGNKQIIVSGTILTIKTAADGTPYVEFQPDNGLAIYCAFAPSDSGQLVNLRSNQQVRIEGTCSGTFEPNANLSAILGVSVQNCSVK